MDKLLNISELSKTINLLNPKTKKPLNYILRYWEKEFKQIQPKTNARGKRSYRQKDIEVIRSIYVLVKEQGFTLEGAKKALIARKGASAEAGAAAKQIARESTQQAKTQPIKTLDKAVLYEVVERLSKLRSKLLSCKSIDIK